MAEINPTPTTNEEEPLRPSLLVAIVDSDPRLRTRLAVSMGESIRASLCASLDDVEELAMGSRVVIIAGPSFGSDEGVRAISNFLQANPNAQSIIATDQLTTTLLQHAMRAGISDVLSIPFETTGVEEAIARAEQRMPIIATPAAPTSHAPSSPSARGKAITVFSTKGGAGKSVIASNLAVSLAQRTDRPVVLLDADLQFGDVAVMLKLTPQQTIVDVVNSIDHVDVNSLPDLLVRHERSGLYVLPAPTEPAFADQIPADIVVKIVNLLRDFAEYVVIDTPANFGEVVLGLIEASDDIVLVAGMDIPNIKNVKIGLQVLRLLDVPSSKLRLVLNRANAKVKLDIREVERTLQLKADCLIPSDVLIPQSVNRGVPAILEAPRSEVTRAIESLADLVMANKEAQRQKA